MKYLVSITLLAIALCSLSVYQGWLPVSSLQSQRRTRFTGVELINTAELRALLPNEKSTWWWHWNHPALATALSSHPLVESVAIHSCAESSWSCFEFAIKERKAAFVSRAAEGAWYVGADGGFIAPLGRNELKRVTALLSCKPGSTCPGLELIHLPLVDGVAVSERSPNLVRGQFRALFDLFNEIEKVLDLHVALAHVERGKEIKVRFAEHAFSAVFSFSGDREKSLQEALRLKSMLAELANASADLAEVELVFNRMAVVRLVDK